MLVASDAEQKPLVTNHGQSQAWSAISWPLLLFIIQMVKEMTKEIILEGINDTLISIIKDELSEHKSLMIAIGEEAAEIADQVSLYHFSSRESPH